MPELIYRDDWSEVWHADCLDPEAVAAVLEGRRLDVAIVDAPYSPRTHAGHQNGRLSADQLGSYANRKTSGARTREVRYAARKAARGEQRRAISYDAWGTTLAAAKQLGRRSIGIDASREHCLISAERLRRTSYTPGLMPAGPHGKAEDTQEQLFEALEG